MSDLLAINGKVIGGLAVPVENMTLLWENEDPTSSFAAQTITLSSGVYDFLLIVCRTATGTDKCTSFIIPKGSNGRFSIARPTSTGSQNIERDVTVSSTAILAFADAETSTGTTAKSTDNNNLIPLVIYGLHKNSVANEASTLASKCMLNDGQSVEDVLGKGSVSVTADGVKTYAQLFNALYALADFSKITKDSALKFNGCVYQCTRASTTYARFNWTECSAADLQHETVRFQSNSSYYSATTTTSGTTFSTLSNTVPESGKVIQLFY